MASEQVVRRGLAQSQLFLDDTWIADSVGVARVLHLPRKYPWPVLKADKKWERFGIVAYGTVLFWRGKFRIWYVTWCRSSPRTVCYAESEDGVFWEKPALGLCHFEGSTANNIVYVPREGGVDCLGVIDDAGDEAWPLKAIVWRGGPRSGLVALRSRDGIHWEEKPGLVLPAWGDRTNVMAAREQSKYVVLGRAPRTVQPNYGVRVVWRTDSRNLIRWSRPQLVMKPDHEDPPRMEIYSMTAFRYESLYLGLIERMHMTPDKVDLELAYSSDSWLWHRTRPRPSFIPWGPPGSWDDSWIASPTNGPIRREGSLWFFYSGRSGAHNVAEPHNQGAIGLATLREDGFASLRAAERPGCVLTPAFRWPGGDLLLNMDARSDLSSHPQRCNGELTVEVRDRAGKPLRGYTHGDCIPLRGNTQGMQAQTPCPVLWKDQRSLAAQKGREIRLAFRLRDCHLYSFRAGMAGT